MSSPLPPRTVRILEEPIELVRFLKFSGLFGSGGEAKLAIVNGLVELNGAAETRKGKKLRAGDTVSVNGQTLLVEVGA
jgi:ribosome-associated protein